MSSLLMVLILFYLFSVSLSYANNDPTWTVAKFLPFIKHKNSDSFSFIFERAFHLKLVKSHSRIHWFKEGTGNRSGYKWQLFCNKYTCFSCIGTGHNIQSLVSCTMTMNIYHQEVTHRLSWLRKLKINGLM